MKVFELIRLEEDHEVGTLGVLKIDKQLFCMTLEPADNENVRNISSIPAQQYLCQRYISEKYGETFRVENVPGRAGILFHSGNFMSHTKGCILLGQHIGKLKGSRAVLNSGKTFKNFISELYGHDVFHLTITENY